VNLLGLFIITDNEGTRKCKKLCDDIDLLIKNNTECHFDKPYKLSNNLLLVNFKSAIEKSNNENDYIDIVKFYCTKFEKLYLDSQSNVVRLNYISLMTQIDPQKGLELVDAFLKENGDLHNRDSFYIYNLNNLKMIIYIMNKKWSEAILLLNYLNKIDIPHYNLNDVYYKKRIEAFKIIIDNKIICDSIRQYNNIIQNTLINLDINCDYFNGLDESWNFFSKAFILSDLQYYD